MKFVFLQFQDFTEKIVRLSSTPATETPATTAPPAKLWKPEDLREYQILKN
jgi:hypothetical protein